MPCSYVTVMRAAAEWLHAGCMQCCSIIYKEVVVPATSLLHWSTRSVDREAEIKCEYRWKVGNNSRGFKPGPAKMTMVFIGQHKKWPRLSAAAWHTFGPRYWFRFQIAARLRAQAAPAPPHKSEFDTSPSPGAVNSENVKIPGNCRAFLEKISFHYEAQFVHISTGR